MRFIVDLYRYLIFGFCAVIVISGSLLVIAALDQGNAADAYMTTTVVLSAAAVFAILVLNLGGIATLISLHDRHADLVDQLELTNAALARIAGAAERSPPISEAAR